MQTIQHAFSLYQNKTMAESTSLAASRVRHSLVTDASQVTCPLQRSRATRSRHCHERRSHDNAINSSRVRQKCVTGATLTFDDDDARGLVGAVHVGGDAAVLAAVLGPAVDNLQRDHSVRVRHRVVELRQLLSVLVPVNIIKTFNN